MYRIMSYFCLLLKIQTEFSGTQTRTLNNSKKPIGKSKSYLLSQFLSRTCESMGLNVVAMGASKTGLHASELYKNDS